MRLAQRENAKLLNTITELRNKQEARKDKVDSTGKRMSDLARRCDRLTNAMQIMASAGVKASKRMTNEEYRNLRMDLDELAKGLKKISFLEDQLASKNRTIYKLRGEALALRRGETRGTKL